VLLVLQVLLEFKGFKEDKVSKVLRDRKDGKVWLEHLVFKGDKVLQEDLGFKGDKVCKAHKAHKDGKVL
jgi:hypothetical protein